MAEPRKNKREFWRSVFRKVMSRYDEAKSVNGTMSCSKLYRGLGEDKTGTYNPNIIVVTITDFICDVELTAKRVLDPGEYRFFKLVYLEKDNELTKLVDSTETNNFNGLKKRVQEKLGLAFVSSKLHPVERYLRPKDMRNGKCSKARVMG
jgi:hypothetical protein